MKRKKYRYVSMAIFLMVFIFLLIKGNSGYEGVPEKVILQAGVGIMDELEMIRSGHAFQNNEWMYEDKEKPLLNGKAPEMKKARKEKSAVQIYQEFLAGERKALGEDIYDLITPTGEPDRRYGAKYAIVDSNRDGIPELHFFYGYGYIIYSCKDNEMYQFESFWSSPWRYILLNNGAFIYWGDIGTTMGDFYGYFELDDSGNHINELQFSRLDDNENHMYDDDDQYMFDGELCTKEEWFDKTREYLFTDEEGKEQISNRAEWTVYCDEIW